MKPTRNLTSHDLQQLRDANPKGFVIKNKYPNRRKRRAYKKHLPSDEYRREQALRERNKDARQRMNQYIVEDAVLSRGKSSKTWIATLVEWVKKMFNK